MSITLIPFYAVIATPAFQTFDEKNVVSGRSYPNSDGSVVTNGEEEKNWKWNFYSMNGSGDYAYLNNGMARIVVRLEDEEDTYYELAAIAREANVSIVNKVLMKGKVMAAVVEMRLESVDFFVNDLQQIGLIEYVEPNIKFQAAFIPDDEYWDEQWNMRKIKANWAWNTTMGNHSVLVAVVDTGIDYNHPDLATNYVPLGYDWVNNDTDPIDDCGHGTHCTGVIAAVTNNSIGVAGLAQVRVMAEKGLDEEGAGYTDQLVHAIIDAVDKGASVISISWGGPFHSELMYEAIKYAYDSGVLLVAAAGNDGTSARHYPAGYDEVVAVAATDYKDGWAPFSNFGEWIEISAPGLGIYSTISESHHPRWTYPYDSLSGTSMACPHVAGVAALILSRFPNLTRDQLRIRLWHSTDDLGDSGFDIYYGYGRVNARKAVEEAFPEHDLLIIEWKRPPYVELESNGTIRVTIFNFGRNDESGIKVQLLANGSLVDNVTIGFLARVKSVTVNLSWTPVVEGKYNVTVFVFPLPRETHLLSNTVWSYIYVGFPLKVAVLDSYGTDTPVTANWDNLNGNWQRYGNKFIYIDYTTLNKENITYNDLVASDADVLIISCAYNPDAGWEFADSEVEGIKKYVYEGHGLIATAGTFCFIAPNNNKLAPLFGLSLSTNWETTEVRQLELIKPDHPLCFNIPNPYNFPTIEGAIPADKKWYWNENAGGSYVALGPKREAAVITYKRLVYISPFLEGIIFHNDGLQYNLQLLYNAITWSRYQKQDHDLSAFLECTSHLKTNETANLNITISNLGLNDETDIKVYLTINETIIENKTIAKLHANSSFTFSHTWTAPNIEAIYNMSVYVHPVLNENYTEDNLNVKILRVTNAPVIGIIKTHWETLRGEGLPDYCEKLGYIVEKIYENLTFNLVYKCDIIMIGDFCVKPWSSTEIEAVKAYIDSGKGFLAIGDLLSSYVQEILEDYGISYAGTKALTDYTTNFDSLHPIMRGVDKVYVTKWPPWGETTFNSLKVVSPAYRIVNDSSNEHIVIAGAEVNGHVLCLSGAFAEYRYTDSPPYVPTWVNKEMFKDIFEWMTGKYAHELAVKLDVPEFTKPNNPLQINTTIANYGSNNETDIEALLLLNGAEARRVLIPKLTTHSRFKLNYTWIPSPKGIYNITVYAFPLPDENVTENNVETKLVFVSHITERLLSVKPSVVNVTKGCTFVINITIDNVMDLYLWEIKLCFNPKVLECQDILFPSDHVFAGKPSIKFCLVDNASGCLNVVSMIVSDVSGVNVLEGTLCQIKLKGKDLGIFTLQFDLESTTIQNSNAKNIPCSVHDGIIEILQLLGDINGDGKVDMRDISIVTQAFATFPDHPRWNPQADIDHNNVIDLKDIGLVAKSHGKHYSLKNYSIFFEIF